jgi:hypothetical protein
VSVRRGPWSSNVFAGSYGFGIRRSYGIVHGYSSVLERRSIRRMHELGQSGDCGFNRRRFRHFNSWTVHTDSSRHLDSDNADRYDDPRTYIDQRLHADLFLRRSHQNQRARSVYGYDIALTVYKKEIKDPAFLFYKKLLIIYIFYLY